MDGGRREGAWDAARRVYRTGGVMAFWDGLGPKVSPSTKTAIPPIAVAGFLSKCLTGAKLFFCTGRTRRG